MELLLEELDAAAELADEAQERRLPAVAEAPRAHDSPGSGPQALHGPGAAPAPAALCTEGAAGGAGPGSEAAAAAGGGASPEPSDAGSDADGDEGGCYPVGRQLQPDQGFHYMPLLGMAT